MKLLIADHMHRLRTDFSSTNRKQINHENTYLYSKRISVHDHGSYRYSYVRESKTLNSTV